MGDHPLGVRQHIVVPESQHFPTQTLEIFRASIVVGVAMLPPVRFDNQPAVYTGEVGDKWTDGDLASEFETAKLAAPQPGPKPTLGIR